MKPMTAKEVEAHLRRCGFRNVKVNGSHYKWAHPDSGRWTIVPHHKNKTIPQGTLKAIFAQSGLTPPER